MTTATENKTDTVTNGVNVTALTETIKAVRNQPEIATFQFRARNQWLGGGHNRSTVKEFFGACEEDRTRTEAFVMDAAEPPVLLGQDQGANPVEYLLHALASCLTTSMVYHAAARGLSIESVESELEGDIDIQGFLGLRDDVRKGYNQIRVSFKVRSDDATADELRACAMFSPVFDTVSRSVPVELNITTR